MSARASAHCTLRSRFCRNSARFCNRSFVAQIFANCAGMRNELQRRWMNSEQTMHCRRTKLIPFHLLFPFFFLFFSLFFLITDRYFLRNIKSKLSGIFWTIEIATLLELSKLQLCSLIIGIEIFRRIVRGDNFIRASTFKVDLLENRASNEKILFYISDLYFHVQSLSLCLHHRRRNTPYIKMKCKSNIFVKLYKSYTL